MASLQRTMSVIGTSLARRLGHRHRRRRRRSARTPAAASCDPLYARRRRGRASWPQGGLDTRLTREPTPTSTGWSARSTTWPTPCRSRIEREARFASDVSHELRSPLTALSAAVEVLDGRRDDLPERSQQALDVVISQVQPLRPDGARPPRDLPRRRRRHRDAPRADAARRLLCGASPPATATRYRAGRGRPEVAASGRSPIDKRRLERIVANLLEQRRAARRRARAHRRRRTGDRVRIVVEDAGPGVPAGREDPHLRALRPRVGGAPPGRHRPRPRPRRRARPPPRWRGLGGGSSGRRLAVRHRATGGPGMRAAPRRRPLRGIAMLAVGLVTGAAFLAGCGLPTDDAYRPIPAANLPFGLADTTTTSTTTTTLPPATTTTTHPADHHHGPDERAGAGLLRGRHRAEAGRAPGTAPGHAGRGADPAPGRSVRHGGLVFGRRSRPARSRPSRSPAARPPSTWPRPRSTSRARSSCFAFGQIVATLTRLPGIGQVEFRLPGPDGVPAVIPVLRASGDTATVVSRDDYANLLPGGI